jgi:hypothetical protein
MHKPSVKTRREMRVSLPAFEQLTAKHCECGRLSVYQVAKCAGSPPAPLEWNPHAAGWQTLHRREPQA